MRQLRVAIVLLVDPQHRFLLQHRTKDAPTAPDYWAFFGGGIRPHETPIEAAKREAWEELRCHLQNPKLVHERDFALVDAVGHMHVFIQRFTGDPSTLELREGQGWGWYHLAETRELKMLDHDREVLAVVQQVLSS